MPGSCALEVRHVVGEHVVAADVDGEAKQRREQEADHCVSLAVFLRCEKVNARFQAQFQLAAPQNDRARAATCPMPVSHCRPR